MATKPKPTCNGVDHWLRTRDGRFLWCQPYECCVCGTGSEW